MKAGNGYPPKNRSKFRAMTFPIRKFPAPIHMEYTTSQATLALSMLALTMTRVSLQLPRFEGGGVTKEKSFIRARPI